MTHVSIKTPEEIEKMRISGRLAADVLDMIEPHVQPGITTEELNTICHDYITDILDAVPAPLNYRGFPKSICTSVNNVVCHGIPSDRRLKDGDIINIDITVIKDEFHGDTSRMFAVGKPSIRAARLSRVCHESMMKGIELIKPGVRLGDLGNAIQRHAEKKRLLSRSRILWSRHWTSVSRRPAYSSLRQAWNRHGNRSWNDIHRRAHGKRRKERNQIASG